MTKPLLTLNESDIKKMIGERIREVLKPTLNRLEPIKEAAKNVISEAVILLPKTFNLNRISFASNERKSLQII